MAPKKGTVFFFAARRVGRMGMVAKKMTVPFFAGGADA